MSIYLHSQVILRLETHNKFSQARIRAFRDMSSSFIGEGEKLILLNIMFCASMGRFQLELILFYLYFAP